MITFLFFLFIALVAFHFIYDGILAPSVRFEIRMNLFALRDKVRRLKIENGDLFSDELYNLLQDDINKQLRLLHDISVVGVWRAASVAIKNKEIFAKVREIERKIAESPVKEISEIYEKTNTQFGFAFLANAGGWVIYLLPVFVLMLAGLIAVGSILRFISAILQIPEDKLHIEYS